MRRRPTSASTSSRPTWKGRKRRPTLSYIVPNACHDGGEATVRPGQPAGPAGAEEFLKAVVPEITASPAYKEGGLIAITSTQAPQTGPSPDTSSCCVTPDYPNLPPPPRRRNAQWPGQTDRRRRQGRAAAALALRQARQRQRNRLLTTTTRCCSASRNSSASNRSATRATRRWSASTPLSTTPAKKNPRR